MASAFAHAAAALAFGATLPACGARGRVIACGVASFAPLSPERYFLPWRPILVSPLSPERFLSARGLAILRSELLWVGVPCAVFWMSARLARILLGTGGVSPPGALDMSRRRAREPRPYVVGGPVVDCSRHAPLRSNTRCRRAFRARKR